jgi:hypothetical protein
MQVLIDDDEGRLTVRRLWPWHRVLACTQAARLDRELAELANRPLEPGPVPARGVAMVTQLLADGTGPLYREGARDDLVGLAERAVAGLTW